jgi:hypothetical protein
MYGFKFFVRICENTTLAHYIDVFHFKNERFKWGV